MNKKLYDLLYRSIDVPLTPDEQQQLTAALASSEELRSLRNDLLSLREDAAMKEPVTFSPFFVERVLARLDRHTESMADRFSAVFRPIAYGALVLVVLLTSYNLVRTNSISLESALGIQRPTLEQKLSLEVPLE